MGALTIYDVAARAGVSIKSVSRVLNGEPNVSEELRGKVRAAVDALGYRPNLSARSLAGSSSFLMVAFVDADLTIDRWRSGRGDDYLSRLELGALIECRSAGYHLIVELVDHASPTLERDVASVLSALKPDGVILAPPSSDDTTVMDVLERRRTPYVRMGPELDVDRGRRVYTDEYRAALEITAYLVRLGHRRIGFIAGDPRYAGSAARRQGYLAGLARHGLEARPDWILDGDSSFASGLARGREMMEAGASPSAIFAANDDMALGALQAAARLGLAAPADISIVGFEDIPAAQFGTPPLTTVRQPVAEMAQDAARMLITTAQSKQDEAGAASHQVDHALVERDSAGPPRLF